MRGRYQQQVWDTREQAVLDALAALSAARGFANITMDELAEAVGISKATLYQHFDSKEAMLVRLMARHTDQFVDWLAAQADQPPLVRLRATMRYLMREHITPLRGLFHVGREDVLPIFSESPALIATHQRALAMLNDVVRQGQAEGTIAADLEPGAVIAALWALSTVSVRGPVPGADALPAGYAGQIAEQMMNVFERGIQPPDEPRTP